MAEAPRFPVSLDEIATPYDTILSDVWGVMHNGVEAHSAACEALRRARRAGKAVILITNAARPNAPVERQLARLGVRRDAWDRMVTSGDVTRDLIAAGPRLIYHVGDDADHPIYDGLDVELVEEFEARAVVCTGLSDDENETPDDYSEMLRRLRARDLPFICANPDIVVERGDRLIWCAGALARDYGQLGGRTLIAGKPHRPIYEAALAAAADVLGHEPRKVLAIGDGALTDMKGAAQAGFDALFVTAGIHAAEYGGQQLDKAQLAAFLSKHGLAPVAVMPKLA